MVFQVNSRGVVEALEEAVDAGVVRTEPDHDPADVLLGQLRLWDENLPEVRNEDPELEDAAA